jgi:O-methyltransferase involved in polyketide biosynthesis
MYFTEAVVRRIFQQTAAISGTGSRFIFTFMHPDSAGRLRFEKQTPLVDWWLKRRGEPFRWGTASGNLAAFIGPWQGSHLHDADNLRRVGGKDVTSVIARGEMICIAER